MPLQFAAPEFVNGDNGQARLRGAEPFGPEGEGATQAHAPAAMLSGMSKARYLFAVLLVLGMLVSPAVAAPAKPTLALSPSSALPGQTVRITGHGFPARARLRLVLSGRLLRQLRSGPNGGFRVRIRVPRDAAAGRYPLAARSRGIVVRRRLRIRVLPQPPQPHPVPEQPAAPEPVTAPAAPPPPPNPPTLVAAGDIACRPELVETDTACRQARTADLVETLAPDAVATLGDNQYEGGEFDNFTAVYHPTWGRFFDITHPAVGNHEYEGDPERDAAPGYYKYFGTAAGDPTKGYYRWQLGGWTLFVLNSGAINYTRVNPSLPDDCWPVSCAAGSEQEQWLRAELDTLPDGACVLAYWHHPRFSSGFGGANQPHPETAPLFEALYEHGAELVLAGHSHTYERFAAVTPAGAPDPAGLREFVVGTGGRSHQAPGPQMATSEVLRSDIFGVLELTLASSSYTARFIGEDGAVVDQSTGTCHPPPAAP